MADKTPLVMTAGEIAQLQSSDTLAVTTIDAGTRIITAAPTSDHTVSGDIITLTAGENLVFGDYVYLKSDGKMWKAKADAVATSPCIAMATATINADASGVFVLRGIVRDDTYAFTVGGFVYLSDGTAGAITQTLPAATDEVIQIVGVAMHADRLYFNPQLVQVEHT